MTQTKKILTPDDIYYMQSEVTKWNGVFNNLSTDKSLIPTYENLVREEWGGKGEYYESYLAGDLVGRADGICDLIFTGMMLAALNECHYTENDRRWLEIVCSRHEIELNDEVRNIHSWIDEMTFMHNKLAATLPYLLRAESEYMDIRAAFDRVLESNYSKAIHISANVDIEAEIALVESQGRYAEVFAEVNGEWIILRAHRDLQEGKYFEKGKIAKSSLFKDVKDLGGLDEFIYV
jgi:hypothetical protein